MLLSILPSLLLLISPSSALPDYGRDKKGLRGEKLQTKWQVDAARMKGLSEPYCPEGAAGENVRRISQLNLIFKACTFTQWPRCEACGLPNSLVK